jgi:predicted  nucleic acid-binding Zn-ribbon protein
MANTTSKPIAANDRASTHIDEDKNVKTSHTDCPKTTPEENNQPASDFFEQIKALERTWVSTGDKSKKRENELKVEIDTLESMVLEQVQEVDKMKKQVDDAEAQVKELEEKLQNKGKMLVAVEEQHSTIESEFNSTKTHFRLMEDARIFGLTSGTKHLTNTYTSNPSS